MVDITIIVRNEHTGKIVEAEMPDDTEMKELLTWLLGALSILDRGKIRLLNITQQFEYNESDTLASRGTKPKDNCLLSYLVVQ